MFGFKRTKKHARSEQVTAPARGQLVSLEDVPDPVFAGALLGPGFAVEPEGGKIISPVSGTVVTVPETRHAVGLRTAGGAELLVHVGVDTVDLKGDGFTARCTEGDTVERGDLLLEVDLGVLRDRVPSLITPVVVTNSGDVRVSEADLDAELGQPVLTVTSI